MYITMYKNCTYCMFRRCKYFTKHTTFVEFFRKASAMRPRLYIQKNTTLEFSKFCLAKNRSLLAYVHTVYGPQGLIYKQLNSWGSGFVVPCYVKNIDKCPPPLPNMRQQAYLILHFYFNEIPCLVIIVSYALLQIFSPLFVFFLFRFHENGLSSIEALFLLRQSNTVKV